MGKVLYLPLLVAVFLVGVIWAAAWLVAALLSPIIGKGLARELGSITGPY